MIADSCSQEIVVPEGQQTILTRGKMKYYTRGTKKSVLETQRKTVKNKEGFPEEVALVVAGGFQQRNKEKSFPAQGTAHAEVRVRKPDGICEDGQCCVLGSVQGASSVRGRGGEMEAWEEVWTLGTRSWKCCLRGLENCCDQDR